ncbi:rCG54805 [Rattus norvegicus]|uniref:RCG54805 n=1 Tax=Rattus norvegicus TaxID=10116 RepID=A6IIB6_RAT|nr:rCG54805 [Rattus norvegicus]
MRGKECCSYKRTVLTEVHRGQRDFHSSS